MDQYLDTVLFDDPDLGKTAYAYIKQKFGADKYCGELRTLAQVQELSAVYAGQLQKISSGEANDYVRSNADYYAASIGEYKRAQQDLAHIDTGTRPAFGDISGIFAADGLAEFNIAGKGRQVFAVLRQKRPDTCEVGRRIVDLSYLRDLQEYMEQEHWTYEEQTSNPRFPKPSFQKKEYMAGSAILGKLLMQGEARQAVLDAAKPKHGSAPPGMSPC